ncbi:tight adherence protein C [Enhydrobacter aerosaccus]|uniref:Tight adherence protein C n=1 Tax=Enhydrobacter aerosaccus TaxID=225324 RepID=A0A1T4T929_9HYPH|nr:type II secretion system F family protein [Enhydrobacter aerosaccus]SKA36972.1 tight adherence protein C [Enhydrobacter aerosaccus]
MDPSAFEKSFMIIAAVAGVTSFWAVWFAITWQPPIEARLKALGTRRMKTRNEQPTSNRPSPKATSLSFMRTIADRLNLLRGAAADQTTRKLRLAGYMSRDAAVVYVFVKLALPLTLGFVMIFLTSVTDLLDIPDNMVLPASVGAVLAGFLLPEMYIKNVTTKRREILNYLLPEGLDLLTICVEAGLSIDAAFRRVAKEMAGSMPELASEFEMTAIELTYLPDRQQALENLAARSDSAAVAALVNALRQTEKYGTPLAGSLKILSTEFRQTRVAKAEEKGARMPALMTVPLMVFILPTLITVLLAPAIMSALNLT